MRQTVVVAFDYGYGIHDKITWRWLERHFLTSKDDVNLILLHIESLRGQSKVELMSYQYVGLADAAKFLAYDIHTHLPAYLHHEICVLRTSMSASSAILHFMKFDAPPDAILVLGSRRHTPAIPNRFLLGSVSADVTTKMESNPVLLIRTRLFESITDLREDTVGAAYIGMKEAEHKRRSVCIAVDESNVKTLVRYCVNKKILKTNDYVQIIHCAADENATTLNRVTTEINVDMREELMQHFKEPGQVDTILLFSGDPRDEILAHVNALRSMDLLIIGNRTRHRSLLHHVIGSTAVYILNYARVPVLMIPDGCLQDAYDDDQAIA
jgi:nucleotide-binding universal stress UspA family protein